MSLRAGRVRGPFPRTLRTRTGGPLAASRDAPVGGQAVLEGVMMRGVSTWAVATRARHEAGAYARGEARPADAGEDHPTEPGEAHPTDAHEAHPTDAGERSIEVRCFPLRPLTSRNRVYRWPVIRGVVALGESLAIGLRALAISANAQLPEADQEISGGTWTATVVFALLFAVGLFFVLPVGLTSLIKHQLGSSVLFWMVEAVLRTTIFLGYLVLLSRLRDMRRVLEYHGAEHKVISCYEASDELRPVRAKLYSRLHPRCGTSFLLIVMIVAIFIFAPVGLPAWWVLLLSRIFGVPVIAGLSFEVIKWAGRNRRRRWVKTLMYPGMQLQRLTTREPDLDQLAVAIAALEAVLAAQKGDGVSATDLVGLEVVA